jgi:hypothetical protein
MSQDFHPVQPHKYGRSLPSPQCTYISPRTSTFSFEKGSGMQRVTQNSVGCNGVSYTKKVLECRSDLYPSEKELPEWRCGMFHHKITPAENQENNKRPQCTMVLHQASFPQRPQRCHLRYKVRGFKR